MMSDGPNVKNILLKKSREEERRSRLVDLGTYGMHTFNNGFQHGKRASEWEFQLLLNALYRIFCKSPARRTGYEKVMSAIESDFALPFCSHRWVKNARVAERVDIWEKYQQIIDFRKTLSKSEQPGQGKPGACKSYDTLLKRASQLLVPVKLKFFKFNLFPCDF